MYRIVNTDNFGGDYPNEKFVRRPCEECDDRGEYLDAPGNVLDGRASMTVCHVCGGTFLEYVTKEEAQAEADGLNKGAEYSSRYFMVVEMPYELRPGFEP